MAIRFTPGGEIKYVLAADLKTPPDPQCEWTIAPLEPEEFAEFQDLLGQTGKNTSVGSAFLYAFRKGVRAVTGFPGGLKFERGRLTDESVKSVHPNDRIEIGQAVVTRGVLEAPEKD